MVGKEILLLNGNLSVINGHFATVVSSDNIELIITKCPPIIETIPFYIDNDVSITATMKR